MATSGATTKSQDLQFGPKPKRNYLGTGFFVFIILFKLLWGTGNFVLGFAPEFIMEYFEMDYYYDSADYTAFYIFLALGVLFIAQIVVSVLAIWKADFFEKNPGWKGSPFILAIVLIVFEWLFTYSIIAMAVVSTFSSFLDIFTFLIFLVKPTNWLARHLRPFKSEEEPKGAAVYPPQKPIQTV